VYIAYATSGNGDFDKTGDGGIIYGKDSVTTDNTAANGDTYGHAVYYSRSGPNYYCDATLDTGDEISTGNVPTQIGVGNAEGNWIGKY
jgi:hypothetical protein